ncbi:hypothetical protein ACJMK2_023345 [Sinanodonta woodiana]|uniref:Uncharacterized protein n=1 Tax=Sinanodonta woodiana TaxID=1069815 RepID=A0ABD3T4M0_SINWO
MCDQFTEMFAHSFSSRFRLLIIYIIIPMHTHILTVLMIRPSQEKVIPGIRVDLDVCYNVTYHTNFLGEIKCSSNFTVYNSQDVLIRYSAEKGWHFKDELLVCMCSCNFNTSELRNGSVVGNGVVSHESYLNYTCNPGFKKTTSKRIICMDGIFLSVENDGNVELSESITESSTIFRENPLSKNDFNKLSNSVHKFVIDSDSWICNGYPALKGFVHKTWNNKVPYKLLNNQEEKCYKDGHIDLSSRLEIGCIKEITSPLIPDDSVHQNIFILQVSIIGFFIFIFITVGYVKLNLARRRVSKTKEKRSVHKCDPQLSIGHQESAPTSNGEFCLVVSTNRYSSYLTGSGELYPTENKTLFYSKSEKCRIACVLTPKTLRKNLSCDDFSWEINSKYLEDDSDGDEYLPEDMERPQCSSTTENIKSWSRNISKWSKSESNIISEKDLQSRKLYTRSHSYSFIFKPAACAVMKENNACMANKDRKEESSLQSVRINDSVKVCKGVMCERLNLNDDSQTCKENDYLHQEDSDGRETTPLMTDTTGNNMKHDDSSVAMLSASLTEDGKRDLQSRNGCMLSASSSKSDMNLCHLPSKGMDPDSSRRMSDSQILKPSLLEKARRAFRKNFLGKNVSHC